MYPKPQTLNLTAIPVSKWAVFLTVVLIGYLTFNHGVPFIMDWDLFGHNAYLPSLFQHGTVISKDLGFFEKVQQQYGTNPQLYQFVLLENGNWMTKYTCGWQLLLAPFYLVAEIWAGAGGFPRDGFSWPYQCMLAFGAFSYFVFGLIVFRKLLLHFFTDRITAAVVLLTVFGTNFLFMQYASLGITHNLQFFLVSCLLLQTIRFHNAPSIPKGVLLGLITGLIGLVRLPDLLLAIFPVAWNFTVYGGLISKIRFFMRTHWKTLIATAVAILTLSPQLLYWKTVSGHWLINSYANNPGEGFDWFTPYTIEVLFSFRKGWLLYTPIMLFAVAGFFCWRRHNRGQALAGLFTFLLFLYVVSCWTTWWYAESFSQRALVDIYPLLGIALGYFLTWLKGYRRRIVFAPLITLVLLFNLFQTLQMTRGVLHGSAMTKAYYWSTFGQTAPPTAAQRSLLLHNWGELFEKGFQNRESFRKCYEKTVPMPANFKLTAENIYTPAIDLQTTEISPADFCWIRATWKYKGNASQLEGKIFNAAALYKGTAYTWVGKDFRDTTLIQVDTLLREITFDYPSPHLRRSNDPVRIGVWNQSGPDLEIESVRISCYEPIP